MTYEEVAKELNLPEETAKRYVYYMRARWAETEAEKCATQYAHEWAIRFKDGNEYVYSDAVGMAVLQQMSANDSPVCEHCFCEQTPYEAGEEQKAQCCKCGHIADWGYGEKKKGDYND